MSNGSWLALYHDSEYDALVVRLSHGEEQEDGRDGKGTSDAQLRPRTAKRKMAAATRRAAADKKGRDELPMRCEEKRC